MSLVDRCLAVLRLLNAVDILLSIAITHIVPHVAPIVFH